MSPCYWCGDDIDHRDDWCLGNKNRERDRYRGFASDRDKVPFCSWRCRAEFQRDCRDDPDDVVDAGPDGSDPSDTGLPDSQTRLTAF